MCSPMPGMSDEDWRRFDDDLELEAHWKDCPFPPDAGCEPCHQYARRQKALGRPLWAEDDE